MSVNRKQELKRELVELLRLDPEAVAQRLRQQYDCAVGTPAKSIVLCGAGFAGKVALSGLRSIGIEPLAFADNNPLLWGKSVEGLRVLSPAEAADTFRNKAIFVVTIYNGARVKAQMESFGGCTAVPFTALFFKYSNIFLPHLNLELPFAMFSQAAKVERAFELWADDESRAEYIAQLKYITSLDSAVTPPPLPAEDTYFPPDLVECRNDEVFVDCGAFDGDTLQDFLKRCGGSFENAVAIEPDPDTHRRLNHYIASAPATMRERIQTHAVAVGATDGMVAFQAHGTGYSKITAGEGTTQVECASLDTLLAGNKPTYIKMDIEGAEVDALNGARSILAKGTAVLAVCNHHSLDDLWRVPLAIHDLSGGRYRLYLRRYAEDCWETMCYGIPPARAIKREEILEAEPVAVDR
jgi:FkbM family methyltransferase